VPRSVAGGVWGQSRSAPQPATVYALDLAEGTIFTLLSDFGNQTALSQLSELPVRRFKGL